ncbi:MAG: MerC domain-containing protein, partial [Bacteroidota bacterium]
MSDSPKNISFWDRIGIGVSVVCAIHCLLFPVLVALLPIWPALGGHYNWVHPLFLVLIVPTVFYAARRSHYDRQILRWLLSGLLLVTVGWLAGHLLNWVRVEP